MGKKFLLMLLSLLGPVHAEYTIGLMGAKNSGEHIFETGNKYPNLSGIRGGSRITYNRDFPYAGIRGGYYKNRFAFLGSFSSTGWNQHTSQKSRDEDFLMGNVSTEKGTKISLYPTFLHDTAHTFTGTQNFADGIGKSTVSQYFAEGFIRYYLNPKSSSSIWEKESSFFLSAGLRYTYFKYTLYDVMQYVQRPFYYGPIGIGLTYSYSSTEIPIGFGYSFVTGKWKIEPSFHLLIGFNRYRDFHVQRALNFIGRGAGNGFLYKLSINYLFSEKTYFFINIEGHRFFSYTTFYTKGGLSPDDVLSNYAGRFRSYVNTKESSLEIGFMKRWGESENTPIPSKIEKQPEDRSVESETNRID